MMTRTTLHCSRCGSEQIYAAASVVWQAKRQVWELAPRHYWMTCANCDCGCLAEHIAVVEASNLTPSELFNCCTGYAEPDWSIFVALDIGPVIALRDIDGEISGETQATTDPSEANFWTVYAQLPDGDFDPITDLKSRLQAEIVIARLAEISGLTTIVET